MEPEMVKQAARRKVRQELHMGRMARPDVCERCGLAPKPCSDGRAAIHAHHHDYSKPLEVEWICAKCHRGETPLPEKPGLPRYGTENGRAKITEEQVLEIRASTEPSTKAGIRYGISSTTVLRIRRGTTWKQLAEDEEHSRPTTEGLP